MPRAKIGETPEQYIKRCMADPETLDKYPEEAQRYAVCASMYDTPLGNYKNVFAQSYDDYPKAARENAKTALKWAEENGWGRCGTGVGKARANQLAKGEAITETTIARMAGFARHKGSSERDLGDGCGRLMWLAWGGDEGIEWAQRKLKQIRGET